MQTFKQVRRQIEWKDLRQLSRGQIMLNVLLPYPFLALSWYLVSVDLSVLACFATYFFFTAGFRQGHDIYHRSLGIKGKSTTFLLYLLSALTFTSLHAIGQSHLEHHRDTLGEHDEEGHLSRKLWWQALLGGVSFRYRIYVHGWRLADKTAKRHILVDSVLVLLMTMLMLITQWQILIYQFCIMFVANALVGIVGVWGMHHDCDGHHVIARTERNPLINALTFNLLYHAEHHLFPAVPSNHLPELAKRLDTDAPQMTELAVVPFLPQIKVRTLQK